MKTPATIENNGQRVLTTAQLAESYGTDSKVISYNYSNNKNRYTEGRHYYRLRGDALRAFREFHDLPTNINTLYLWTEKGALLHAKSLNTDKAWEVYDFLVDNYFKPVRQLPQMSAMEMIAGIANNAVQLERVQAEQAKQIAELQQKSAETSDKLNSALDVFTESMREQNWKENVNSTINNICKANGLSYLVTRSALYVELEEAAHCNLDARISRMQKRMKKAGATYRQIKSLAKITIIENDPRLKAIFDGIVKKFAAKYIQHDETQPGMFQEEYHA